MQKKKQRKEKEVKSSKLLWASDSLSSSFTLSLTDSQHETREMDGEKNRERKYCMLVDAAVNRTALDRMCPS